MSSNIPTWRNLTGRIKNGWSRTPFFKYEVFGSAQCYRRWGSTPRDAAREIGGVRNRTPSEFKSDGPIRPTICIGDTIRSLDGDGEEDIRRTSSTSADNDDDYGQISGEDFPSAEKQARACYAPYDNDKLPPHRATCADPHLQSEMAY